MQNNFPMLTLHSALTTGVKSEPLYENPISNKFGENSILKYSRTSTDGYFVLSRRTVHTLTLAETSLQRQRQQKRVPNCQNNLSTTASFFSD